MTTKSSTNSVKPKSKTRPASTPKLIMPKADPGPGNPTAAGLKSKSKAKPVSKREQLIRLLSTKSGTELTAINSRLGWLPHTTRAALSGLRKSGYAVITDKRPGDRPTRYRIEVPAAQVAEAATVDQTPLPSDLVSEMAVHASPTHTGRDGLISAAAIASAGSDA